MPSQLRHIFLLLIGAIFCLNAYAQDNSVQGNQAGVYSTNEVFLAEALDALSNRFKKGFIYRSDVVENKRVHLSEGSSLEEMLNEILIQHNLIAIRIGKESFVVLPFEEKEAFEGVEIIGGSRPPRSSTLAGHIRTTSGEPLQGAQVYVEEVGTGTVTGQDGAYMIEPLPPGRHLIYVSFLGFQPVQAIVDVEAGRTAQLDLSLRHDILQLDGIVTTATRIARLQRQSVLSLSVLNSQELYRLAPNSQADILRGVPGVHAEGGGGEVHANLFIRGLPAPGQYKYSTVQEDGMPLITESGITSSAIDAYFRYDLGVDRLEFARGGNSSLYGVASPVGIINYISKTGGDRSETVVRTSLGERNLYRFDVNTGGPIGRNARYNFSGFYRYDEGPVVTGLPTEGMQLRGNVTKLLDDGYIRVFGKYLNDRVQFFLPFPHESLTGTAARGIDGEAITTLNSRQGANFVFQTPGGVFESTMEDGIATKGPSLMIETVKDLANGLRIENKTRWSDFNYKARLFLPFPAFQNRDEYAEAFVSDADRERPGYIYTDTGESYSGDFVVDQGAFHWIRPVKDLASKFQLTKSVATKAASHDVNAGVFLARTTARQRDIEPWILTEFADRPRLLDLMIDHAGEDEVWGTEDDTVRMVTQNGLSSASRNYTNIRATSNRVAVFAGDEITIRDRLRLDVGLRYEIRHVRYSSELPKAIGMEGEYGDALAVRGYQWGSGKFIERTVRSQDLAASVGVNYTLTPAVNLYGVASRSHFFPQVTALTSSTEFGNLDNERFIQIETGVKYGTGTVASTLAAYVAVLDDRFDVDIRADSSGAVRNRTVKIGGSRTIGVEWTWGYIPRGFEALHFFGDLTFQAHRYRDFVLGESDFSGNQVERQPRFMVRGGVSLDKPPFFLSIQAKHTGDRFASADNMHRLEGYTLVQFDAGYTIPLVKEQWVKIGVNVFNLLNSRGLTEGDPRLIPGTAIEDQLFFNARPVLPRRAVLRVTYLF